MHYLGRTTYLVLKDEVVDSGFFGAGTIKWDINPEIWIGVL
jgi:hypothetical protein